MSIEEKPSISANGLKWIAITAMLIDHIAWKMELSAALFTLFHGIGRLTMPIMCFLMAEGFKYTRSKRNYALRLLIFAVISQMPFNYFMTGNLFRIWIGPGSFNVIFCLLLGLCSLWAIKSNHKPAVKSIIVALCLIGAVICDWMIFGVLWILAFGLNKTFKSQAVWFSVIAIGMLLTMTLLTPRDYWFQIYMQLGVFLPLPLMALYNGKLNGENAPTWSTNKWVFYTFYPVHLLILGVLHYWLGILI